ncbi:MAG: glycosyltransferase [Bacilli bacterium]|nr:glycosyltransferase [Bacilli bacterium]
MKNFLNNIIEINKKYNISLILYVFCFLFAPPFFPKINSILILTIYSAIMLILKYKNCINEILNNKIVTKCFKILIIYFILYVFSILVNGLISGNWYLKNYILNIYSFILAFPVTFICSFYLIFRCEKLNLNFDDLVKIFIKAGLIQAFLTIISLLVPPIKNLLVDIMYVNTGDKHLIVPWIVSRRFYGFSNSMLDLFGFGTGILAVLALFYSLRHNYIYLILASLLLAVPFLNSRSGLIIFAIGVIFFLIIIFTNHEFKKHKKYIFYGIIGVIFLILIVYIFSPNTIDWIINDFSSFFTNRDGTASVLFSKDFWAIPPLKNWLIGTSYSISAYSNFSITNIAHSDVGYINELWKTGIIGSLVLYYFIFYFIMEMHKSTKNKEYKMLSIFFIFAIAIFMIKGSIFAYNPGSVVIYTLGFMLFMQGKKEAKVKKENKMLSEKMIDKNILVSVVVPIYNVEQYLQKCLNSICNQTYKNLEILLINDGAKDNSLEICNKNAKKDERIKVVSQKNGGLSKARNTGLKKATGEYICFIDADDFIDEHYIEYMLRNMLEYEADICACDFHYINEDEETWSKNVIKNNQEFTNIEAICDILGEKQTTEVMAWNKLYKRSLFIENNIIFPVGKLHEDNFTTYKLYYFAKKITLINDKLYFYLQRNNSIMSQKFNTKRLEVLDVVNETREFFKNHNLKIESELIDCYELLIILNLINTMMRNNYVGNEKQELINKIRNNKKIYLRNKYIGSKNKLLVVLLGKKGKLYSKILSFKGKK